MHHKIVYIFFFYTKYVKTYPSIFFNTSIIYMGLSYCGISHFKNKTEFLLSKNQFVYIFLDLYFNGLIQIL